MPSWAPGPQLRSCWLLVAEDSSLVDPAVLCIKAHCYETHIGLYFAVLCPVVSISIRLPLPL